MSGFLWTLEIYNVKVIAEIAKFVTFQLCYNYNLGQHCVEHALNVMLIESRNVHVYGHVCSIPVDPSLDSSHVPQI